MELLNFLLGVAGNVYEWFGWLYEQGRSAALYALRWAIDFADRARTDAVNYASRLVGGILDQTLTWIDNLQDWVSWALDFTEGILRALIDNLAQTVSGWVQAARDWAAARITQARSYAANLVTQARSYALSIVQGLSDTFHALINQARSFASNLVDKVYDYVEKKYGWLLGINAAQRSALLTFIKDPLGAIIAYVLGIFPKLVSYALGLAFGTVKYSLPTWTTKDISEQD